jgi:hypothetical protein
MMLSINVNAQPLIEFVVSLSEDVVL